MFRRPAGTGTPALLATVSPPVALALVPLVVVLLATLPGTPGAGAVRTASAVLRTGPATATDAPAIVAPKATAPAGYPVTGIDVSNHQGAVNWASVAGAGASFSYVKATEGTYFTDTYFDANYNGAKRYGLLAGAYHYARPDQSAGAAQADYFLDRAQYVNDGRTMLPMLDIEWPWTGSGSAYPCYGLSTAQMRTWIRGFVDEVRRRTGQQTMIYTNPYWWNPCTGGDTSFGDNPLFLPNYTGTPAPLPAGWSRWTLWQYSSSGTMPGDQNVYNGTRGSVSELTGTAPDALAEFVVVGDWDGNGTVTTGLVRAEGGVLRWYLRNSNTSGVASAVFSYGSPGMRPVVGDWDGNRTTTPGAIGMDGGILHWYLTNVTGSAAATLPAFSYGNIWMWPVVGDWDGNGTQTPGAVVTSAGALRWYLTNLTGSALATVPSFSYGNSGMWPIAGDWDGNRTTTPGAVLAGPGVLRWFLRNSNTSGVATIPEFGYAIPGMLPLVGDWDGNRTTTPGAVMCGPAALRWFLRNSNSAGDATVPEFDFGYPAPVPQL